MSDPAYPLLAAGAIVLAAGVAKSGGWPDNGGKAVIGTVGLVVVGTALGRTAAAPIVSALAWLILLGAVYGSVPALAAARSKNASQVSGKPVAKTVKGK